ncbi:hypothetical protein J2S74_000788 [Evansella vedderi]|uniref:Wadjet protein JetD C-terminal domain-containing protein n=1 Tax=Evansella vedderi TaxID=38282 RepID=A0ABT9ZQ94_9BACI|nr:Wadjet anti-phage system protein JetD domain-containing protein [Evansella vedderi]MDQ0253416.1 hypothetical protein [Evansella vedderi]
MEKIKKRLVAFPKKSISLVDLEELCKKDVESYEEFSSIILKFEKEGILKMVKAKGQNSRPPFLAFQYRINKSPLKELHHQDLQRFRLQLHPTISIDHYYKEDPSIWKKDLPFIQKIDEYIKEHNFPIEDVPAPERSFELVGDEKWITEKGGKELLEKLGIYDRLKIIPVSDPLMFAINPITINHSEQLHLIVENKTTYQGLLPILRETKFSTLIYGSGKKIIKSIEQFPSQYPVQATHKFLYFGDVDREGISIWYSLNNKQPTTLALPFYRACLKKEASKGKGYQRERSEAMEKFQTFFQPQEQEQITNLLEKGLYLPQETLKTKELQEIWRESDWTGMI